MATLAAGGRITTAIVHDEVERLRRSWEPAGDEREDPLLERLVASDKLAELERLPTVDHARIDVRLPATLAVTIDERKPVLVWRAGAVALAAAAAYPRVAVQQALRELFVEH